MKDKMTEKPLNNNIQKRNQSWIIVATLFTISIIFIGALYLYFIKNYNNVEEIRGSQYIEFTELLEKERKNQKVITDDINSKMIQIKEEQDIHTNLIQSLINKTNNSQELYQNDSKDAKQAWLISEIEYLLKIANSQYTLTGDIEKSIQALNLAMSSLKETNNPNLNNVKQAVEDEIKTLNNIKVYDSENLIDVIDQYIEKIDFLEIKISLNTKEQSIKDNDPIQFQAWASAKKAFKEIISIRRNEQINSYKELQMSNNFISIQLKKLLDDAKLALIIKNKLIYQETIINIITWLKKYYDQEDKDTKEMLTYFERQVEHENTIQGHTSNALRLLEKYQLSINENIQQ
ncbi:MAG: uroporphyrinogen-III C-methyltransferase [Pseudomonadota bacterium]|nr:uroporphyrinogen-III C-methyltransferase [Pseudomonadota bacterium]